MAGCTVTGSDKVGLAATLNKVCLSFLVYWLVLLSASIFRLGFLSNCTAAISHSLCHLSFHSLQLDKQKPISASVSVQFNKRQKIQNILLKPESKCDLAKAMMSSVIIHYIFYYFFSFYYFMNLMQLILLSMNSQIPLMSGWDEETETNNINSAVIDVHN